MKKLLLAGGLVFVSLFAFAQFPPPAGQPGTTAIYKDSSVFTEWVTGCSIVRGYEDITDPSLGYASAGDSTMAFGMAGTNGTVSLGDGGSAIVTFDHPVVDGPGWDFAVFENAFNDTFLELAYVEVSSDGINYFRFPCTSNTQDTLQIGGFGSVDASMIDNLAGKYRALYGTPFDLQQLAGQAGLNINAITHIKIIDVVGCITEPFANYDQYGNKINELWNTPFPSGGFDLDAVGVIHSTVTGIAQLSSDNDFEIYPNPAKEQAIIRLSKSISPVKIEIRDCSGKEIKMNSDFYGDSIVLNTYGLKNGIYFISIIQNSGIVTKKLVIAND